MTQEQADALALDWIEAWNAHNLEHILSHYADNVTYVSPFAVQMLGDPRGEMRGKAAVRDYFTRALAAFPDLRFEFGHAFAGVDSLVIHYKSVRDLMAAEYFELGEDGKFTRVQCHYRPATGK
ncbi:MAG: nuclear transport factor 2 family protein [Capsulimonas sp.]|uniref:nuclear transport factor 2 family protein n=1 Tax=Capsulimonas sp. TaxID=2494211 RepID=UPI0032671C25